MESERTKNLVGAWGLALIRNASQKGLWIGHTSNRGDNFIVGYARQWNPLSEDGGRRVAPKALGAKKECRDLGKRERRS